MDSPVKLIKTYASFVKFAHTVFALPFAMVGMMAACAVPTGFVRLEWVGWRYVQPGPDGSLPIDSIDRHMGLNWVTVAFILTCMVGARSFAMAVNRLLDSKIDALNPRTATRELPTGTMTPSKAWTFAAVSAGLYFFGCAGLGPVALWLSPIPILLMAVYPLTKRVTALCHLVLGTTLGLAPIGAWIAVRSYDGGMLISSAPAPLKWGALLEPLPWLLGGAVATWVAGFDVIYALQDDEFDRANRLHSIPAKFGRRGALWISRGMHASSAALFFAFTWLLLNPAPVGGMDTRQYTEIADWVWVAPCVMLAGMIYQHSLVRPNDLSRVNLAFFTVNGVISVLFGAVFLAAWLLA